MAVIPVPDHKYHAEATAFHGHLVSPLPQIIPPHSFVKLKPEGGYLSQDSVDFRLERIVTFDSSHTQVSGRDEPKSGGWATLSTSVVEGLNILEVITIDRVVAQISTVHYRDGYTPYISFLGTRFENFRIAGYPVDVKLNMHIVGDRPAGNVHYHSDPSFKKRVKDQCDNLLAFGDNAPTHARDRYTGALSGAPSEDEKAEVLNFSLVEEIRGDFPGKAFGHVIHVPDFGDISLATVALFSGHYEKGGTPLSTTVELTMLEVKLGCLADGIVNVATAKTNGPGG